MANYQITNRTGAQVKAVLDKFTSVASPDDLTLTGVISGGKLIIGSQKTGTTLGTGAIILGVGETASGDYSCAKGGYTISSGNYSNSEGYYTTASGHDSHAEGNTTTASQTSSHAEGHYTTASGSGSHAEGASTTASGSGSHAEGGRYRKTPIWDSQDHQYLIYTYDPRTTTFEDSSYTVSGSYALGICSHAEGVQSFAAGYCSHAEGFQTKTSYDYAHTEGYQTLASGSASHAEGYGTKAQGMHSHTEGYATVATGTNSTVIGKWNAATRSGSGTSGDPYIYTDAGEYSFIIGNGISDTTSGRHNSLTVDENGYLRLYGSGGSSNTNGGSLQLYRHKNNSNVFIFDRWEENGTYNRLRLYGSVDNGGTINGNAHWYWYNNSGVFQSQGEIQVVGNSNGGTYPGGFRHVCGNYGSFFRNDATNSYWLITPSGQPFNGIWNGPYPIYWNNASHVATLTTSSDIRLKNVLGDMPTEEAFNLLNEVKIINYVLKEDEEEIVRNGIVAQDLKNILIKHNIGYRPYFQIQRRQWDSNNEEENIEEEIEFEDKPVYTDLNIPENKIVYGIDYGQLTPILWKGWQIHEERIKQLEEENTLLKQIIKEKLNVDI